MPNYESRLSAFAIGTAVGLVGGGLAVFLLHRVAQARKLKTVIQSFSVPTLPLYQPEKISIICSPEEWHKVSPLFAEDLSKSKVLGLDCEWVLKNPISLLQLATCSGHCALLRLNQFSTIPESLVQMLFDRSILKVGVAVNEDAKKLRNDHSILVEGCVDLRHIAMRCDLKNTDGLGLRLLSHKVLNFDLEKNFRVQCSNWEAEELSPAQVKYAAMDSIVAERIFARLFFEKFQSLPTVRCHSQIHSLCQGIVDLPFFSRSQKDDSPKSEFGVLKKTASKALMTRQRPLYDNFKLEDPDGQALCTCDMKKAAWYIDKGLGSIVDGEPFTVRLNFQPAGRPIDAKNNYYLQEKECKGGERKRRKICVVCGADSSYLKKNIVPHEYRKYFPPQMKNHKSHDILLLCCACHRLSCHQDYLLRQKLKEKCCVPQSTGKYVDVELVKKAKYAAKALLVSLEKLPAARVGELQQVLRNYFQVDLITESILKKGAELDTKLRNENYLSHGEAVVIYFAKHEDLSALEIEWRKHFVEKMEPKFLPKLWSVNYVHEHMRVPVVS